MLCTFLDEVFCQILIPTVGKDKHKTKIILPLKKIQDDIPSHFGGYFYPASFNFPVFFNDSLVTTY